MNVLTAAVALAAAAMGAPSEHQERGVCSPGSYGCGAHNATINVCDAQGNWQVAGPCPDGTVCQFLPQNDFELPFCVNAVAKRDDTPEACTPATYTCAQNETSGADGIRVCDTESVWQYVGDCPNESHCEYFPSGIPFCVDN